LFRETNNLPIKQKQDWAHYINSFQREEDGLFYPDPIYHPDKERAVFQATSFCLTALRILDSAPGYSLNIVNKWRTKSNVEEYLFQRGCHLGKGGSGNKAMFQAIFMTHEFERTNEPELLDSINAWFDFHNRYQNPNGFWGNGSQGQLYKGLQNAFHQFVIYEYWNKDFPRLDIVAQTALDLQDKDGFFSALPGGSSCKDYDSLHFLFATNKYFTGIMEKSFGNALVAFKSRWNNDGGFCENSIRPYGIFDYPRLLSFILRGRNNKIRLSRGKEVAREIIKPKKYKSRTWVMPSQPWGVSTLWDTWFRCLTFAEISCLFNDDNCRNYKFPEHIGIGYNNKINDSVFPSRIKAQSPNRAKKSSQL
jgi:hypothetical protein